MFHSRLIPAGTGEKMQYLAHDFNDNTIRFVLRYPSAPDETLLKNAVRALIMSVDVLHASFHAGKVGAHWQVHSDPEESSYCRVTKAENAVQEAIEQSLQPIETDSPSRLRCTLVRGKDECALAVCISHLCVDGSDGKYLLMKLAEAYTLLSRTGSCKTLQVKNGNRAAEQLYESLSREQLKSLKKYPLSDVKTVFPFPTAEAGTPHAVWQTLSAQTMARAHVRAKELNATVNDLLLTACYQALSQLPGIHPHEALSVLGMMDLRRHLKGGESEGLCNMSGSLPTALHQGAADSFEETLALIAEQTRQLKENPLAGLEGMPLLHGAVRTLPLWLLLRISERVYSSMGMGLTNVGALNSSGLSLDGLVPDACWFGGPLKHKPGLQVSAVSLDSACTLMVAGQFTQEDAALVQGFLYSAAETIRRFAD